NSLVDVMVPSNGQKLLGTYILRVWLSSIDYQADVRISQEILKQITESYRKIRNTFRFMLGNLNDFDPEKHTVSEANLEEVDQYMLVRLQQIIENVRKNYD